MLTLLSLPQELIADILAHLDLCSLLTTAVTSKQLRAICEDSFLNPWQIRLHTVLRNEKPDKEYKIIQHLSCYTCIPRRNWLYILTIASPEFILFNDIPWLPEVMYEEAFKTRFLPSWVKWRKSETWKRTFKLILMRVYHRLNAPCTADESWTNYVILSRQGNVNLNAASSRQYNPQAVFNIYKEQNNLSHQPSTIRLILQLADVRIVAIGTIGKSTSYQVNRLAKEFIHPSGIHPAGIPPLYEHSDEEILPMSASSDISYQQTNLPPITGVPITRSLTLDSATPAMMKRSMWHRFRSSSSARNISPILDYVPLDLSPPPPTRTTRKTKRQEEYGKLTQPRPIDGHRNFPQYTVGGQDLRWPPEYDGT